MIDQATLDELWDFGDPIASEARFRVSDVPELQTQLARALGLQGRFEEAHAVLDENDVPIRTALERGGCSILPASPNERSRISSERSSRPSETTSSKSMRCT